MLSEKDEKLIALLRDNGRMSVSELARRLNCSRTAAQMRLQKLEQSGVIMGYTLRLAPAFRQNRVRALVLMRFAPARLPEIEAALAQMPDLRRVYSISGHYDLAVMVSSANMAALDGVIDALGTLKGVDATMTSVILSTKLER